MLTQKEKELAIEEALEVVKEKEIALKEAVEALTEAKETEVEE